MKAKRINLCVAVRNELHNHGVSSVRLVNAVNAALGELESTSEESKLGDGRITKTDYKVSESTTTKYSGSSATIPLRFDAWHSAISKAEKIASFETVSIPGIFKEWIQKFVSKEDVSKEKQETVAS